METKTDKYPNGYEDKLNYWTVKRDNAFFDDKEDDFRAAVDKLEYFTKKQAKWESNREVRFHPDGDIPFTNPSVLKFWCESSYDHEDTERDHDEWLVIAVDMGEEGTKTIGEMRMHEKETVEALLEILNQEKFGS